MSRVAAVVLAAGGGRRMGAPKALVRSTGQRFTWIENTVQAAYDSGCATVLAVVGAQAQEVTEVLRGHPVRPRIVTAPNWKDGMGHSLRCGLAALSDPQHAAGAPIEAALVWLVDTPDVGAEVGRRVLAVADRGPSALARASYTGRPGHPVLIGRGHWAGVHEAAQGDRGARDYLRRRSVKLVECGDLAAGHDVDHPSDQTQVEGAAGGCRA